jgi:micrococcal nuclease
VAGKRPSFAVSRRRRNILFVLGVLFASVLIGLDHSPLRHKWRHQPHTAEQSAALDFEKYHSKTFAVVNVVDGDTLDINVPDGRYDHTRIRLWGVDTPETKKPNTPVMYFGPEAYEFTMKLTLAKPVTVYLDKTDTRDKYNRLLAYIQLSDGRYLNELLLSEGFAYFDFRFRHSFYNKYKQLESAARNSTKGLWEKVTPDQMPHWRREKVIEN